MKLEEEIKQKSFSSEFQKAGINLLFTGNWINSRVQEALKKFDITNSQFNVLRILRGQHPASISTCDIRSRMLDKMSDASRLVSRLLLQELVEQNPNKDDKRLVDVRITKKGLKLLEKIDKEENGLQEFLSALSVSEAKELNRLLDKLRQ